MFTYFFIGINKMKKTFSILLLIFLASCSSQNSELSPSFISQNDDVTHVILLAGQSNMEGAGSYDALDESVKERISRISSRVSFSSRGEKAKPLSYTLSPHKKEKYGFVKAFGPELFVGLTLAEKYPSKKFLLIKTAYGGTSLYGAWNSHWDKNKAAQAERGFKKGLRLFDTFKQHIDEQITLLEHQNIPYKILGMMWMQGENDAAKEFSANSYKDNLIEFIYQNRLNADKPALPFIIGQINSTYGRYKLGPKVVRNAMVEVAKEDPNVTLIPTSTDRKWADYPKHKDNTHYNTEGQKRLGLSFASALLEFLN